MLTLFIRRADNFSPADGSERYWFSEARGIFDRFPEVESVEIVRSGRKTDSTIPRGVRHAPPGRYVIVASTGGKWGKSRRDFAPR